MKLLIPTLLLSLTLQASASVYYNDRVKAWLLQQDIQDFSKVTFCQSDPYDFSTIHICGWRYDFAQPALEQLPDEETTQALFDALAAQKEAQRQASKPLERKQYENQFFSLTEELFNLTGVTNEVTPKLGFPELQAKIEQIQATDPMAAVNLSLKLLTIDAALKRYDTLWWDDAVQHELPEN